MTSNRGSLLIAGILALALAICCWQLSSAKEVIQRLEGWQGGMVQTIRLASGNTETTVDTAQAQVQAMGTTLTNLHSALKTSNDAVDRLADETRRAQEAAAREAESRAAAILYAEQVRDELIGRVKQPVPRDQIEQEIRKIQDATFDAGL